VTLVHYFSIATDQYLGKSQCLFANYFAERYGFESILLCNELGQEFPALKQIVPFLKIKKLRRHWHIWRYIIHNAKSIDVFFTVHFNTMTKLLSIIYKLKNKKGVAWCQMDVNSINFEQSYLKYKYGGRIQKIKHHLNIFALRYMDIIQIEHQAGYNTLRQLYPAQKSKIFLLPNPINTPFFSQKNILPIPANQKENWVITVSRIGSWQKNNEMMLEALNGIKMNEWKFIFVGGIVEEFRPKIKSFFERNPSLKNQVVFIGEITDKMELYHYYQKAKAFCLTSRFEGFCHAQLDSLYFGLFNISTPVSGWEDISDNKKLGDTIQDASELRTILSNLFDGNINPCIQMNAIVKRAENFYLPKICEKILGVIQNQSNRKGDGVCYNG
jgi:glycosyltransferase involved in cell wall biosynthesis